MAIAPINRTRVIKLMESNPWSGSPGPRRCRASPCSGARALPSPVRDRRPRRAGQSPRVRIVNAFVRTRRPGHDPEATPWSIGWRMPVRSGSSRPVRRRADGPSRGGAGAARSEGRIAVPRGAFGPGRESVGSRMGGVESGRAQTVRQMRSTRVQSLRDKSNSRARRLLWPPRRSQIRVENPCRSFISRVLGRLINSVHGGPAGHRRRSFSTTWRRPVTGTLP